MTAFVVTGTDTGIGKTVFAAMLTLALDGIYWKPIQSGTKGGTDTETVKALTGLEPEHFRAESYVLSEPVSPHRASEIDGIMIDTSRLALPRDIPAGKTLVIEGAGGVLVPIRRDLLQADLFARWGAPVILCARTSLGTINHTLLSLEALKHRNVPVTGVAFIGDENTDSERTICEIARVPRLGRLPRLKTLDAKTLRAGFAANFDRHAFDG